MEGIRINDVLCVRYNSIINQAMGRNWPVLLCGFYSFQLFFYSALQVYCTRNSFSTTAQFLVCVGYVDSMIIHKN